MRKSLLFSLSLLFVACSGELVGNKYCDLPARFVFTPVNSISQLRTSCESMGEWCSIEADGNRFLFTKPDGSQGIANRLQITGYTGFYMGLTGFIVGLPTIPEMDALQPVVTCYDLACRNCYDDFYVARRLELREGGFAYCSRCQRTYNLNNTGQSDNGKPLFRYRVYYGNNTLSISN